MKADFYHRVYQVVRQIPPGRVCSYGAIARFLGSGRSARLVGTALKKAPAQYHLPAHRVLNRLGMLSGKHQFGESQVMEELLRAEGLTVKNDRVLNFERHFWDPAQNLNFEKY